MKSLFFRSNLISIAVFVTLTLFSCGKEEDPILNNSPVPLPTTTLTSYSGSLSYSGANGQVVVTENGIATIQKSGSSYAITFSDNVPTLSNLIFENRDGEYASTSQSGSLSGIVIEDGDLDIGALVDGSSWAFSGSR